MNSAGRRELAEKLQRKSECDLSDCRRDGRFTSLARAANDKACRPETELAGWAYRTRTGESVRALFDWICVTIRPEVGASRAERPLALQPQDADSHSAKGGCKVSPRTELKPCRSWLSAPTLGGTLSRRRMPSWIASMILAPMGIS